MIQLTHFQAVEWKRVLPHELVTRRGVVVFNGEAHQRQLRHVHVKLEAFVPCRVETFQKHGARRQELCIIHF